MDLLMEREWDNTFIGVTIAVTVGLISGLLFYMFKNAAISSASLRSIPYETSPNKKKTKKQTKKPKRKPVALGFTEATAERDIDKIPTSDETVDEDEPSPNSNHHHHLKAECGSRSSSTDNTEAEHHASPDPTPDHITDSNTGDGDFCSFDLKNQYLPQLDETPATQTTEFFNIESAEKTEMTQTSGSTEGALSHESNNPQKSSKRSKRRSTKRSNNPFSTDTGASSSVPLLLHDVHHMIEPIEEVTNPASFDEVSHGQHHTNDDFKKLMEKLRIAEGELQSVSDKAAQLTLQNDHLRQKEEENRLGLHVLQDQYQELLRMNKTIEHEKHTKENRIKHLESEKKNLLIRLEAVNTEASRFKVDSETEIKLLRDELKETQAKLASIASAQSAAPNPELVRTQELAQLMSNENRLLKNSLELRKAELTQLRQAHMRQQQELQAFQVDNLKLRENQDSALDELRAKFQVELTEANSRIASYEAQLQRQSREMDLEKQELSRTLEEVRTELSSRMDREKRLSEIISSLEYQFSELSAEKLRLLEKVNNAKAEAEMSTNSLLVQVANLTNDLAKTTADLHATQQRADAAIAELEHLKARPFQPQSVIKAVAVSTQTFDGDCKPVVGHDISIKVVEELQSQLQTTTAELICAKADLAAGEKLQETTQMEVEHYKTALLQTEDLLAKLQVMVKDTEADWRKLLCESESDRERLKKQLAELLSKKERKSDRVPKAEPKKVNRQKQSGRQSQTSQIAPSVITSPTCLEESTNSLPNGQSIQKGAETEQTVFIRSSDPEKKLSPEYNEMEPSDLCSPEGESEEDIDAVLVDDTDLHVPDDIWDTTTMSANYDSELTVHPEHLGSELTSNTVVMDNENT